MYIDYDYDNDFSDGEESSEVGGTSSQAQMEKLLLDNLSSDDEDDDGDDGDASSEKETVQAPLKKKR